MNDEPWKKYIERLGGLIPAQGDAFVPLRHDEINLIEEELGEELPDDYRTFLATYGASNFNCLTSIRAIAPLPESLSDDGLLPFGTFYGINRDAHDFPGILFCAEQFNGMIPAGLLPIGDGGSDDQICIDLKGERRGRIFYWDSQGSDNASDLPNTYYIADSFTDLLNRIEQYADGS